MTKITVYLDTSVISFLFAEDAPEKMRVTREFFERYVRDDDCTVYISDVVIRELGNTKDIVLREKLLRVIREYPLVVVDRPPDDRETQRLAAEYIRGGVVPRNSLDDALHIAFATVMGADFLLSWNYRHLANVGKEFVLRPVNGKCGYLHTPRLCTPLEFADEK